MLLLPPTVPTGSRHSEVQQFAPPHTWLAVAGSGPETSSPTQPLIQGQTVEKLSSLDLQREGRESDQKKDCPTLAIPKR